LDELFYSPFFGIFLSLGAYGIGIWLCKKLRFSFANPILFAIFIIVSTLLLFDIPVEAYNAGGDFIRLFLPPATAALALAVYRQLDTLKKNWLPIFFGCLAGCLVAIGSIFLLCHIFGLDEKILLSLVPKSVTTPVAMPLSEQVGGIVSISIIAVLIAGLTGAVFSPFLIRFFRIKNPVVRGIAIGTCSHALGTSKALEIGEVEGAMSGLALNISALITVLLLQVFF